MTTNDDPMAAEAGAWHSLADELRAAAPDTAAVRAAIDAERNAMQELRRDIDTLFADEAAWVENLIATVLPSLRQRLDDAFDNFVSDTREAVRRLADGIAEEGEQMAGATRARHEELCASLRARADSLIVAIKDDVDRLDADCDAGAERIRTAAVPAEDAIVDLASEVDRLASDIGRCMAAVDEARHLAGSGMRAATGGLNSIKSTMDEIM